MLELKYGHLRNVNFLRGINRLANYQGLKDPKALYNIMRITKKIEQEGKNSDELFMKVVKQYAELDEKGDVVCIEDKPGMPKIPEEKQKEYAEKLKEFMDIDFKIERFKVKLSDVVGAGFSAKELEGLEDILDTSDLEEKPTLSVVN